MTIRYASSMTAAALLACGVGAAQAQSDGPRPAAQASEQAETSITLVGCVQREADYRRQNDSGRGGVAGTGLGRGNEYVLINASKPEDAAAGAAACTSSGSGEAYELTGERESEMASFVGRPVQVTGRLKSADVEPSPVGTSGSVRPEGGFDPLGQDLRLFELDVASFTEPAASQSAAAEPPPPAAAGSSTERPVGTSGSADAAAQADAGAPGEALPRTASSLAMTGLAGLLSLAGAFGVRLVRSRW